MLINVQKKDHIKESMQTILLIKIIKLFNFDMLNLSFLFHYFIIYYYEKKSSS